MAHKYSFVNCVFGEQFRLLLIILVSLMLLVFGMYSQKINIAKQNLFLEDLTDCISGNSACPDGLVTVLAQIKLANQKNFIINIRTKTGARWEDLYERNIDITVISNSHQLSKGQTIALQGHFASSNTIILKNYETEGAWIREIKYGISLLALIWTGVIWIQTFSFSFRKLIFVQKRKF